MSSQREHSGFLRNPAGRTYDGMGIGRRGFTREPKGSGFASTNGRCFRGFEQWGFTLIEIILVVLILSVIAAMALPNFSRSYVQMQFKGDIQELVQSMKYAQSRAVGKNTIMRISFDTQESTYWLEQQNEDGDFERFRGRMAGELKISGDVRFDGNSEAILFYPDGQMDKTYIYICRKEICYTVSTKEQRGFVHILEGEAR